MVDSRLVLRICMERFRHYPVGLEKLSDYTYNIIPAPLIKATGRILIPEVRVVRALNPVEYQPVISNHDWKCWVLYGQMT